MALNELAAILKKIGPISKERLEELAARRDLQEMQLGVRGIAPIFVQQRFLLQKECPDDDRHVLAIRLDPGRVSITPSYAGLVGIMAVAETDDRLVFTLGAEPCRVRVVLGTGDLAADSPPATDPRLLKPIQRPQGARSIDHIFYLSPPPGCAQGSASVRVYWGSVDHSYLVQQTEVRACNGQYRASVARLFLKKRRNVLYQFQFLGLAVIPRRHVPDGSRVFPAFPIERQGRSRDDGGVGVTRRFATRPPHPDARPAEFRKQPRSTPELSHASRQTAGRLF